jgi:hypothetical protein
MREGEENEGKMWEAVVRAMNFVVGLATTKKRRRRGRWRRRKRTRTHSYESRQRDAQNKVVGSAINEQIRVDRAGFSAPSWAHML